jgi:hypothetical protein
MIKAIALLPLVLVLAGADVMPVCGSHHDHQPAPALAPGSACGGPASCGESTRCVGLDQPWAGNGSTTDTMCSKPCKTDNDCGGLSVVMRCTGMGKLVLGAPSEPICLPAR